MTGLYPEQPSYESGHLDVGDGCRLAFKRYGNPQGQPIVYLHGGPGAGTSWEYRLFNPEHYNILLFDQRGAGASLPKASVQDNTIDNLVGDIEKLRTAIGVEKWAVTGGSWGSALGMFYAASHPERVSRMLLRGVFFAERSGADYIIEADGSAAKNRNSLFDQYEQFIPATERSAGLTMPYYNRLTGPDQVQAIEAARLFDRWDTSIATYVPKPEWLEDINKNPAGSLPLSRIFFHYAVHQFQNSHRDKLLTAMSKLEAPVAIIHGKDDYICPVGNAIDLHTVCRNSTLTIVHQCGHAQGEPGLRDAFIGITDQWVSTMPVIASPGPQILKP